jgi:hypothetical protein
MLTGPKPIKEDVNDQSIAHDKAFGRHTSF